ncbi:VOC family protein [Metabacillus litoralis]|uniref:VOC family protein n=1 Tax=Metabacillus litoralis TaxID=152268 RepID=UPI001B9C03E9|nr:VOC family protein [Metabacillus litoralis]MCM3160045.1 VOC family protein [Metabacillus litoralis]MCM3408629.1 VOC family protein [Metabacillus litoralis]UHA59709.1 VOC family protein [Metabacillus litoralis]
MIKPEGIHHVSLSVTDLNKAKQFYGTVLGFKEIERPKFDFPGAWYQIGTQQLHLIVDEVSSTLRKVNELNSREGHFAIRVNDYEETLTYLKDQGVPILEKPKSKSGFAQIFCMDPDFNLIEFNVDQETMNK